MTNNSEFQHRRDEQNATDQTTVMAFTELADFVKLLGESSLGSPQAIAAREAGIAALEALGRHADTDPVSAASPMLAAAELAAFEHFERNDDQRAAMVACRSVLAETPTDQTWPIQMRAAARLPTEEQAAWLIRAIRAGHEPAFDQLCRFFAEQQRALITTQRSAPGNVSLDACPPSGADCIIPQNQPHRITDFVDLVAATLSSRLRAATGRLLHLFFSVARGYLAICSGFIDSARDIITCFLSGDNTNGEPASKSEILITDPSEMDELIKRYVKGAHLLTQRTPRGVALNILARAGEHDPSYALYRSGARWLACGSGPDSGDAGLQTHGQCVAQGIASVLRPIDEIAPVRLDCFSGRVFVLVDYRARSSWNEISYPLHDIVDPLTCGDVNPSGFVVPFRLRRPEVLDSILILDGLDEGMVQVVVRRAITRHVSRTTLDRMRAQHHTGGPAPLDVFQPYTTRSSVPEEQPACDAHDENIERLWRDVQAWGVTDMRTFPKSQRRIDEFRDHYANKLFFRPCLLIKNFHLNSLGLIIHSPHVIVGDSKTWIENDAQVLHNAENELKSITSKLNLPSGRDNAIYVTRPHVRELFNNIPDERAKSAIFLREMGYTYVEIGAILQITSRARDRVPANQSSVADLLWEICDGDLATLDEIFRWYGKSVGSNLPDAAPETSINLSEHLEQCTAYLAQKLWNLDESEIIDGPSGVAGMSKTATIEVDIKDSAQQKYRLLMEARIKRHRKRADCECDVVEKNRFAKYVCVKCDREVQERSTIIQTRCH